MTPREYCQEKTASSGSSFYFSFLFLPEDTRRAITALYAFCREVDDVVDECSEDSVAASKLDWWHKEIDDAYHGTAHHPVCVELQEIIPRYQLPQEYFNEIIKGMQMDLARVRYDDMPSLEKYCYRAASVVGLLSAKLFGYEDSATEKYAHDLGMAFQLTNIIRDVREDAARNRIYLPRDLMDRHRVKDSDLRHTDTSPNLRAALDDLARTADDYYESALQSLPEQDRWNQRSGLIMSAIYHRVLERIRDNDFDVMAGRTSLPTLYKLWIAWRTARNESRRHRDYLKTVTGHAA